MINSVKWLKNNPSVPFYNAFYNEPETEMENIHSFSFNAKGVTNIEVQNDNDPYEIHNHLDAVNILAYWLKQSLNENS